MRLLTIIFLTCSVLKSCAQQVTSSFVKQKKYQGYIFPKEYSSNLVHLEDLKERFTPSVSDIIKAEVALVNQIRDINKSRLNQSGSCPVIDQNLPKYKRQYIGYINQNGDKIIWINFIGGKEIKNADQLGRNIIVVLDGCSYYWNIKVNISKGLLYDLYVNGAS